MKAGGSIKTIVTGFFWPRIRGLNSGTAGRAARRRPRRLAPNGLCVPAARGLHPVGLGEQHDGMHDPGDFLRLAGAHGEAPLDLKLAARVCRRDNRGAGRAKAADLAVAQPARGPGLGERVHASAPAAHRGLRALAELDAGDRPQDLARLCRYPLTVAEVAGLVVGDRGRPRSRTGRGGPAEPDLDQPLRDVADLRRPRGGARGVPAVPGKEVAVAPEVGAAPRRVRYDRVVPSGIDRVELAPRELRGRLEVAVVDVQRAAAGLGPGRLHLAAVLEEHVDRRPVHVGEADVLDAAGEDGDPEARRPPRPLGRGDDLVGEAPADREGLQLDLAEPPWKEREEARPAQQPAEPARLVEPQDPGRRAQRPRAQEEEPQRHRPDKPAPGPGRGAASLGLRARRLEERRIVDPGGAGGRARQAPEAVVHLPRERPRRLQFAVRDRPHERDPPPGRMALPARLKERGAGRQAEAAVHALLEHRVVQRAQEVRLRSHGSKIFPGLRDRLTRLRSARLESPYWPLRNAFLARPTPCSPVIVPPSARASAKISRIASSTRRISSASLSSVRKVGWRLPSPKCPKVAISRRCRSATPWMNRIIRASSLLGTVASSRIVVGFTRASALNALRLAVASRAPSAASAAILTDVAPPAAQSSRTRAASSATAAGCPSSSMRRSASASRGRPTRA